MVKQNTNMITEQDTLVYSWFAAKLLGINENHLRQLVHRKILVPQGKHGRKNVFRQSDVLALKTQRDKTLLHS